MENKEKQYMEETQSYLVHTYNPFPIVVKKGEGVYLYDEEGNKYLDFTSGYAVASCLYTQIPESRINTELFNHHQKTEYPYNHTENAF